MDLGEKDDMCDYEKIHRLIESTYKNILKNFNPGVKQLIVLGKALQKTTQNVGTAFKAYNECLYELARGAESCKGSTKELGLGLVQLTDSQNEINQQLIDGVKVFHAELLIPLKAKQENEFKHTQALFDKYLSGHKYHTNNLKKAQNVLERYKKKHKIKPGQKEMEKTRQMRECKRQLEEYLRKNLRLALLEERKRYCYLFNRLLYVVEDKVKKYQRAVELLMDGLRNWPQLCRSPHILPRSSEQVIQEFGLSDETELEEEQSGDEYHSTISVGTTLSLNRRDLKLRSPQRYGWSHADQAKLETSSTGPGLAVDSVPEEMARKMSAPVPTTIPLFDSNIKESTPEMTHMAPTPPPGILCAIYPYVAATDIQMSLEANDIIRVFGETHNGWVYGRNVRTSKEGWFPLSFTDFNEDLVHWKSTLLSHHQVLSHTRNASLSNIRANWFTEPSYDLGRRPSRCSEADAAELSAAAASVAAAAAAQGTTVSSRPMSSASPTENAADQFTARTKFQNRRTLALEPISEQIPPPEEFRDGTYQVSHSRSISSGPEKLVPAPAGKMELEEGETEKESHSSHGEDPSTNAIAVEVESCPAESTAGNQPVMAEAAISDQSAIAEVKDDRFEVQETSSTHQSVLAAALPPPPVLLPPTPPTTSGGLSSRPPPPSPSRSSISASQSLGSENSAFSKRVQSGVTEAPRSVESTGDAAAVVYHSSVYVPAPSQPAPPPPPPPPLPPESYHPRSEYFVQSRLRKAGSIDSTKTT